MAKIDLKTFKIQALKDIKEAKDLKELDAVYKKYLGKKGELTLFLRSLKDIAEKERKKQGKIANELKKELSSLIGKTSKKLQKLSPKKHDDWLDVTIPVKKPTLGHLHPLTSIKRQVNEIFQAMGFSIVSGPEVETEWYNFDALNIPKDHPARDAWDTFWLKGSSRMLLRTHTSPVQIRYMEKNNPPLRIIVPGRCFRHEATDASHDIQFEQLEGLMVGKKISVGNFKAIILEFFQRFFHKSVDIRLRPSFFPFTEPSFEVDMSCVNCKGKGCSVCSQTGWLEMLGAGMVNPEVYKSAGLNPKNWQGFAFGIGIDRLAMMKYKVNDIRLFYGGDLRFLRQF